MVQTKFERAAKFLPNRYKVGINGMVTAFVRAWCEADEDIETAISQTKNEIFVRTASGKYLDRLGSGYGVYRPTIVNIGDEQYKDYIELASYQPKAIRSQLQKLLDIFWDPILSHSTVTSTAWETYDFSSVVYLNVIVDNNAEIEIKFDPSDFAIPAAGTAEEVCTVITRFIGDKVVAQTRYDTTTTKTYVQLYTRTYGNSGSIQITGGTANSILGFDTIKIQSTLVDIIEIFHKQIIIKIPSEVSITSGLPGAAYFHADETIYDPYPAPVDPSNPFWPGNYFYDPSGTYFPTNINMTTTADLWAGNVYSVVNVTDSSSFPNSSGYIVAGFGSTPMEFIPYLGRYNNSSLMLDPTYSIINDWPSGTVMKLWSNAYVPKTDGSDYPIYFNDTMVGEEMVRETIELLKAAGVLLEFEVYNTHYLYQDDTSSWYNYTGSGGATVAEAWFQPPQMNITEENAMVAGFGPADRGKIWFNTTTYQLIGWNGTAKIIIA